MLHRLSKFRNFEKKTSKWHHWFKGYGNFVVGVDFTYGLSCIRKGLRLRHAQQACLSMACELLHTFMVFSASFLLNKHNTISIDLATFLCLLLSDRNKSSTFSCSSLKIRRGSPVDDRPSTDKLHHFVRKKK